MINRIVLMGRLTADPEVKQTQSGISQLNFSVAVERNKANRDGTRQTDFIPCQAWRQTADFIGKYFRKGSMIAIDGSLQSHQYTDQQGNNRTAYQVVAEQVSFAGSKSENAPEQPQNQPPRQQGAPAPYSQPQQRQYQAPYQGYHAPPPKNQGFDMGDFGDFEELDNDSGLPF